MGRLSKITRGKKGGGGGGEGFQEVKVYSIVTRAPLTININSRTCLLPHDLPFISFPLYFTRALLRLDPMPSRHGTVRRVDHLPAPVPILLSRSRPLCSNVFTANSKEELYYVFW